MKPCLFFILILIAASCDTRDAANHCVPIELHAARECAQDGAEWSCKFEFLQPYKWGQCGMAQDESLLCETGGFIEHHPKDSSGVDWSTPATSCAVLHDEIQKHGQGPEMDMPITIRTEPE